MGGLLVALPEGLCETELQRQSSGAAQVVYSTVMTAQHSEGTHLEGV